ncbi:MAG: 7-carboxy-7-deazaguanine synthase QueE [Methanobacteriaceae archaeon]|nr:7-carboxy-7-deazaguanine synthase QueE [Methanobacteriaceae archaeon]
MKARINEIFSSIQGEGLLVGRRQIFVRLTGCNLDCNYCDTPQSRDPAAGDEYSVEELYKAVINLLTPDFHSVSFTGGEPLLHADFLRTFIRKYNFKYLLETNGSLPDELAKISNLIDYASVDIKLPEHNSTNSWNSLFDREIESLNLLIDEGANIYCKLVIMPSTKIDTVEFIASKIHGEVSDSSNISLVIQPISPLDQWQNNEKIMFEISENAGKYMDVLVIPQIHKILKVR